jgi:osmotically-inducible protein OsmY
VKKLVPSLSRAARLAAAAAGAALVLGACGGREPEPEEPPAPPAEVEPVRELTPDERLAEQVRQAMLQAPALNRENVRIAVVQGQVFLTGEVSAPHLRDEAVAIAGEVPGVRAVHSKVSVRRGGP